MIDREIHVLEGIQTGINLVKLWREIIGEYNGRTLFKGLKLGVLVVVSTLFTTPSLRYTTPLGCLLPLPRDIPLTMGVYSRSSEYTAPSGCYSHSPAIHPREYTDTLYRDSNLQCSTTAPTAKV